MQSTTSSTRIPISMVRSPTSGIGSASSPPEAGSTRAKVPTTSCLRLAPRSYLEIVAPDPRQPEPEGPRPYGVEDISHGRLVGWALACDDIEAAVARARSRGFDPGAVLDGRRLASSGALLRWRLTGNALSGGLIPFLISWGETRHPAVDALDGLILRELHLEHDDLPSLRTALAALDAAVEVRRAPKPAIVVRADRAASRSCDDRAAQPSSDCSLSMRRSRSWGCARLASTSSGSS